MTYIGRTVWKLMASHRDDLFEYEVCKFGGNVTINRIRGRIQIREEVSMSYKSSCPCNHWVCLNDCQMVMLLVILCFAAYQNLFQAYFKERFEPDSLQMSGRFVSPLVGFIHNLSWEFAKQAGSPQKEWFISRWEPDMHLSAELLQIMQLLSISTDDSSCASYTSCHADACQEELNNV